MKKDIPIFIGIVLAIMLMTTGIVSADSINKIYGIDFSPYKDGQNPEYGSTVSSTQVQERMQIISPYTIWIRSYGTENGLEYVAPTAHNMGLKTAIGAWLSADSAANERQINELINEMKAGHVDLAIVGSETLFRNDLSEEQLINYIKRVKEAAPGINVTTADTYGEILSHPNVIKECDVIMYNVYPYWEGIGIENAITVIDGRHKNIVNIAGGKAVIISETGWPSGGNTIGSAIPSPENSARYFNEFVSWARENNIKYLYFEAFDETWKSINEGPQGAHWGIWDKDGNMKPGMETVFNTLPNTISYTPTFDNRLKQSSPTSVLSTSTYVDIGRSTSSYRDVMLFDLSSYKTTDTISKATLSLYWYYPAGATRTSDTIVEIYRPVEWDPKYVTWNNRASGIPWSNAGGSWYDKNGVAQGTTPYASLTFAGSKVPDNKYYDFDVTQLVQEYVSGKYKNTGFFMKAKTESGNYIAFYSSEWTNAAQKPKLTVTTGSNPVDNPPVLAAIGNKTVNVNSLLSFTISATDPDGEEVTYSATGLPTGAKLDATTGLFTWTPTATGEYTVTFTATSNGQIDDETIWITVPSANDSLSHTPTYDNRLREASPTTVISTSTYVDIGRSTSSYRDVMLFDLSSYKTTDTISKATLSLYWYYPAGATRTSDTVVEVYRPAEWDPKYVTWNNRASGTPWSNAGGSWYDKNGVAQGTTPYASLTFAGSKVPDNKYYDFDVTQLVQEYVSGKYKNTGFFMKAKTESGNYIAFYSSDWTNAAQKPKLTITRTSPIDNSPIYYSENSHYYDMVSSNITWDAAKDTAEKLTFEDENGVLMTGHLATITSKGENDFIIHNFPNSIFYWLGGFQLPNSEEPSGGWTWVTGEEWNYSYWVADREPTNFYTGEIGVHPFGWPENALEIQDGLMWNDFPHDIPQYGYIVEYELPILMDNPPVANAGSDKTTTVGTVVTFDGSASTDDKPITSYAWNFGDSTTATGVTPTHKYTAAGTYTVTLTVTDTAGQKSTDTLQVVVTGTPIAVYDNRLKESSPTTVLSTASYIDVGRTTVSYRDVMLFDLSSYKTTDTISKAILSLYWYYPAGATRTSETVVEIYRPVEWDPKYVTWNNRASGIPWSNAGGSWYDKNGVAQGTTPYASLTFAGSIVPDNKYYEFDVTQLVQEYVSGKYKNTGFFMKAKTESGNYIAFYSSEWTNAAQKPKLTVNTGPVDNPPILAAIGSKTVNVNSLLSFTISATDPNGDKITYSATGLPTGAKLDAVTGKFTWTPAATGKYSVMFIATANSQTDSETITITVNEVPNIKITSVSPYGTSGSASGTVTGVDSSTSKVAVYIYVPSGNPVGWWIKPYSLSPLTNIASDGTWSCDIDTGGVDIYATKVAAFLIPVGYVPPSLLGGDLPPELYQAAIDYEVIDR